MDFSWNEEQLAFKEAVVGFARRELNDRLIERDHRAKQTCIWAIRPL